MKQACRLVVLVGASLLVAAADAVVAQPQNAAPALCQLFVCKRLFQANEMGITFRILLEMRRLGLSRPDWMYRSLQATADDLNARLSVKELAESENSPLFDPMKELSRRVAEAQGEDVGQSFDLGSQTSALLLQIVGLDAGHGDLVGARSQDDFIRNWRALTPAANTVLARVYGGDIALDQAATTSAEAQASLCGLEEKLHQRWEVAGFVCEELLERLRFVVTQAAALEAAKPTAGPVAKRKNLRLDVLLGARNLIFRSDNVAVDSIDIWDFQDHRPVTPDDVVRGDTAIAVRLGRDNDMAVIAAFREGNASICTQYLYLPLRNGDDIVLKRVATTDESEVFSIKYGNYLGVAAIRHRDFVFLWDPATDENPANWHLVPPIPPVAVQNGKCVALSGR